MPTWLAFCLQQAGSPRQPSPPASTIVSGTPGHPLPFLSHQPCFLALSPPLLEHARVPVSRPPSLPGRHNPLPCPKGTLHRDSQSCPSHNLFLSIRGSQVQLRTPQHPLPTQQHPVQPWVPLSLLPVLPQQQRWCSCSVPLPAPLTAPSLHSMPGTQHLDHRCCYYAGPGCLHLPTLTLQPPLLLSALPRSSQRAGGPLAIPGPGPADSTPKTFTAPPGLGDPTPTISLDCLLTPPPATSSLPRSPCPSAV